MWWQSSQKHRGILLLVKKENDLTYAPKCRHLYKTQTNTMTDFTITFSLLDSFKSSIIMSPLVLDSCSNIFHCASLSTTLRVVLDLRLACADVFLLFNQNYCGVKSFTTIISAQGQRLLFLWLAVFSFYKSNISASDVHTTLLCVCEFICKNQDIGFLWGTYFATAAQYFSVSRVPS